jgi:hypothetical protein
MAVVDISEPTEFLRHFAGLSGDAKPTGVRAGSTFLETDHGHFFITPDGTNWTQVVA